MDGTIDDARIIARLDHVANVIEGLYIDLETPIIVPDKGGISVMGNWARIKADVVSTSEQAAIVSSHLKRGYGIDADVVAARGRNRLWGELKKTILGSVALDTLAKKLCLSEHSMFRASMSSGFIVFDFPLSELMREETFVPLLANELPNPRPNYIPIGTTMDGDIVSWMPEDARQPHMLVAGISGSGKTVLCNTIISGLARAYTPAQMKMFLTSGKIEDVALWDGLPHLLHEPTSNPQTAFSILRWVEQERHRRSEISEKDFPFIVLYIGECSLFVELNPKQYSDALDDIMKLARSEKIIVIAATQRPRGDQVGSIVSKSQFGLIFCGRVQNNQDSYVSLGKGEIGAEYLPGNGAFVSNDGVRFQAAFFADSNKPDEARRLVNGFPRRGSWKVEYVELDDDSTTNTGVLSESDVLDVMEWLAADGAKTTSISEFMTKMAWGYSRARRVFSHLQSAGVLGEERDNMKRVQVFRDKLGNDANS